MGIPPRRRRKASTSMSHAYRDSVLSAARRKSQEADCSGADQRDSIAEGRPIIPSMQGLPEMGAVKSAPPTETIPSTNFLYQPVVKRIGGREDIFLRADTHIGRAPGDEPVCKA